MGNSTSALTGYEIGSVINEKSNYFWTLYNAIKKNDSKNEEELTLFKFTNMTSNYLTPANRHIQKLKTIKHPYILTYIDSSVLDDSLLLVTERCIPLELWINNQLTNESIDPDGLLNELLWGFHCILNGLEFLHNKCKLIHNYICYNSIYITTNGDWKLAGFELTTSINNNDDMNYLIQNNNILSLEYQSKERINQCNSIDTSSDIYSLSQVILNLFKQLNLSNYTDSFIRLVRRMNSIESKRRPTTSSILQSPEFTSEYIQLLKNLIDFTLKSPLDITVILNQINESTSLISKSVFNYKIVSCIMNRLKMSITDFNNRDTREASRQIILSGLNVLNTYAEINKLDESIYSSKCVHIVNDIWQLNDRSIRSALLKACKSLIPLTSNIIVNKNIFDALMTGFNDSNAKMREETLKNLIYVVDKLDEKHLQERLVRCISTLQNDAENSIRTNATIFLGRIAIKLKETTRARVLCPAFVKAMRDGFAHCRVAGLKAAIACKDLIDISQLTTQLLPQVSLLLIDKNTEVRNLSINFIETILPFIKSNHEKLSIQATNTTTENLVNESNKEKGSNWTSWAVDGLTKTLDIVVNDKSKDNNTANNSNNNSQLEGSANIPSINQSENSTNNPNNGLSKNSSTNNFTSNPPKRVSSVQLLDDEIDNKVDDRWDDDDINWSDSEDIKISSKIVNKSTNTSKANTSSKSSTLINNTASNPTTNISTNLTTNPTTNLSTNSTANLTTNPITNLPTKSINNLNTKSTPNSKVKPVRLIATKIETKVDEDWDDF